MNHNNMEIKSRKAGKRMIDDSAQIVQVHFQNPGIVEESENTRTKGGEEAKD